MNIRMIATDVDGTIQPEGGEVSRRTRDVIAKCRAKGIPVVICSGRWFPNARDAAVAAGCIDDDYLLSNNGNLISTVGGKILKQNTIPIEDAEKIHALTKDDSESLMGFTAKKLYIASRCEYYARAKGSYGILRGEEYICEHPTIEEYGKIALKDSLKLESINRDPVILAQIRKRLEDAGYSVSSSRSENLEIMTKSMGKGHGVLRLAEMLGISREEIMVFGDYTNDLDMFAAVEWSVAVGNAVDELKRAAKMIAPSCREDGVARTIEKYVLGE